MPTPLRILLIQPAWDGLSYRRKVKVSERAIHPLTLGVVAALSPGHEVRILDEARETMPESATGFDVVGLSVNTFTAPRAYRLADRFRKEGVPVVFGGPHTALLPNECLEHADSIVIGDAEDTWPRVLQDLAERRLQPRYLSTNQDGALIPAPRRDLFRSTSRDVAWCQMSRGCANQCRFCYLQYMPHRTMRLREVSSVVDELRALRQEIILFVDDNVFCQRDYTKEVLKAITPLGKRWWIQAPTNLHEDEGLVALMAESGCYSVSIGFQTASNVNNQSERILQNRVEDYAALVRLLHRHGILVDGTFIFGFDGDDRSTFAATEELITRLKLDTYTFYFLTPYPGTEYFAQFEREGRILHRDWSRFDWDHVVVQPKQMTVEELRHGVKSLYQRLDRRYFVPNALHRLATQRHARSSLTLLKFLVSTGWNYYWSPVLRD
ncbi:MAG: B12-binding domain-containing radical SAM protein [Verrucomicrobia bacterium]|nr:B12-binding domain-containing radical SAM protein [Verrucomicrobiota bacterium]